MSNPWGNLKNGLESGEVGETYAALEPENSEANNRVLLQDFLWRQAQAQEAGARERAGSVSSEDIQPTPSATPTRPYGIDVQATPNPEAPGGRTWSINQVFQGQQAPAPTPLPKKYPKFGEHLKKPEPQKPVIPANFPQDLLHNPWSGVKGR